MQSETLKYGQFYHIYNRGIDSCDLFREPDKYRPDRPGIQYVLKRYSLPSALADGHMEIWMTELVERSTLSDPKWPPGRGMPGREGKCFAN